MRHNELTRRRFAQAGAAAAAMAGTAFAKAELNPAIQKAMKSVQEAIAKAESDPDRPRYHFRPPAQWNNDPNGVLFYRGWHHMFYQHNPYDSKWGHMHWGHARSRDLVNWEHLPIALWPSTEKKEDHVFSGGAAIAADGRPRLFYTSIGPRNPEQWMAIPADDDLIVWEKYAGNPILTLASHGDQKIDSWRDPFLFREGGKWYMVCGGNLNARHGGAGSVELYEATTPDLTGWKYRGVVYEDRDREINNIECPNLFKLGSKWVLLFAPHKPCVYMVGSLDLARGKFIPETRGILDPGTSYANNVSFDDKGRCILWLWGPTNTDPDKGWNGAMVMQRILTVGSDGYLRQVPAPDFESLRGEMKMGRTAELQDQPVVVEGIAGDCVEIQAEFSADAKTNAMGLRVRRPAKGGGIEISFAPRSGILSVDGVLKLIACERQLNLRVFLDERVIEVYAGGGTAAIYKSISAAPGDLGVEAFAAGGTAQLTSIKAWPMKPAHFSLERYQV